MAAELDISFIDACIGTMVLVFGAHSIGGEGKDAELHPSLDILVQVAVLCDRTFLERQQMVYGFLHHIPPAPSPPLDQWRAVDGTIRVPYTRASFWLPPEDMPAPPATHHISYRSRARQVAKHNKMELYFLGPSSTEASTDSSRCSDWMHTPRPGHTRTTSPTNPAEPFEFQ